MDAKLYCLAVALNTLMSENFPMNKSPSTSSLLCFGEPKFQETSRKVLCGCTSPTVSWKPLLSETFEEFLLNN